MDSQTLFFLFLILPLILISHPIPANTEPNSTLIAKVCNKTIDKAGCLAILRSHPQILTAKNYLEFSRLALELAITKVTETQGFLKGLLKKNPSASIRYCAFFCYDEVVGSFKSALAELAEDFESSNYDAKVAGDGANDCQTELSSERILDPAISSRNNETLLLSSITFAATSFLQTCM
ncbi:hypothetical protein L6164_006969 [Bauhinia variegata]|uniref:Uncharacterized protein n=1 Tax=Bauhinia variegata TaxID=167791 RepID=A0ACB9PW17_BAUVA|nr:hypothetical protein L6164_006969 [Bauhinia variegata]